MGSPASSSAGPAGRAAGTAERRGSKVAKSGPWSAFEDHMLLDLVEKHGDKWNLVAHGLSGRTLDQCKQRHEELRLRIIAEQRIGPPLGNQGPARKKKKKAAKKADAENVPSEKGSPPAQQRPPAAASVGSSSSGSNTPPVVVLDSSRKDGSRPPNVPVSAVPRPLSGPIPAQGSREALQERPNGAQLGGSASQHFVPAHRPSSAATVSAAQLPPPAAPAPAAPKDNQQGASRMTLMSLIKPPPQISRPASLPTPLAIPMPANVPRPLAKPTQSLTDRHAVQSPRSVTPSTPQSETPSFQTAFEDDMLLSAARVGLATHLQSAKPGLLPKKRPSRAKRASAPAVPAAKKPARRASTSVGNEHKPAGVVDSNIQFDLMSVAETPSDFADFGMDHQLFGVEGLQQAEPSSVAEWDNDFLSSFLGVEFQSTQMHADGGSQALNMDGMDHSTPGILELDDILREAAAMPPPSRRKAAPPPILIPGSEDLGRQLDNDILSPYVFPLLSTAESEPHVELGSSLQEKHDDVTAALSALLEGSEGLAFFSEDVVPQTDTAHDEPPSSAGPNPGDISLDEEIELMLQDDSKLLNSEPQLTIDAVLPTDDPIFKRTRQRLSLENFDLQTLEDLLPYSLLNSLHMDVDQARYNSFVKSLQDTVRGSTADAASQRAPSPWPMDDDDAEFDNPENLAEGEEAEVENFAVPRDEIEALLRENADFLASLGLESVVDNVPSNAWAGSTGQKIFTEQQIATLKTQMTQNFQIVTQAYAIQSALHGPQSNDAGIWRHQLQLMKTDGEWAQKLARTQQRENSHFWLPGLALVPKILQMPVDQAAPKAAVFIQKFAYPYTRKEIAKYRTKLEKEAEGAKTKEARGGRKELILPESVQKTIDMCKGVFVPELVPQIIRMRKGRLIMMPEEDSLLALGIFKFGSDDWNEIQAYCLPTRTSKQLKARHKNLVCRRGPDNEVKRMHLNQVQPLKLIEKELLITGVREYGPAFRNVVDRVFPRFPKALISRTWDSLHASEQVPCSFGESASAAPTPCDEGPVVAPSSDVILCRHGETDHYTIAGAGLEYIEINLRLLLKERGLPGKDVRSRLSKNLLHAVIGGKTYSLNSTCRVGPREPPNVPVVAKRKQDMFDFLAEQRKKRIRV